MLIYVSKDITKIAILQAIASFSHFILNTNRNNHYSLQHLPKFIPEVRELIGLKSFQGLHHITELFISHV